MFCLCVLWKKFSDSGAIYIIYLVNTYWHNPEAQYWIWRNLYLRKCFIYNVSYNIKATSIKMSRHVVNVKHCYLLDHVVGNINEHPNYIYIFKLLRNYLNVIPHPQCVVLTTFLNKYVVYVKLFYLLVHVIGNSNENPNYIYIFIGWNKDR